MFIEPQASAAASPARVHGGIIASELRALSISTNEVLDFSVNTNPYGPCQAIVAAIRNAPIDTYPDSAASHAREALAQNQNVSMDRILIGNGASDLLWTIARALVSPGDSVLIAEPTFSEFRAAAVMARARIAEYRADQESDFKLDLATLGGVLTRTSASMLYLCSPNSPTGTFVSAQDTAAFAADHPNVTFVLDESFLSLSDRFADAFVPMKANVIRVRSLTKDFAIPGLRVGYLIASVELIARLEANRPAWATSSAVQAAVIASAQEYEFLARSRAAIIADRNFLSAALCEIGMPPVPGVAPFLLIAVASAAALRTRLLRQRILVRDCASFGLPHHIRVAVRPQTDAAILISALKQER